MTPLIENSVYVGHITDAQGRKISFYTTTAYDKFQYFESNREIDERKLKLIIESLADSVEFTIVLVDEHDRIGDGQHRVEAFRRLQLPVTFGVVPGITKDTIRNWNRVQNQWTLLEHLHAGSAENLTYKWLENFCETHDVHVTIALGLLRGAGGYQSGLMQEIRNGTFTSTREERQKATERIKILSKFARYPKYKTKNFVTALLRILDIPHLDLARLYESFDKRQAIELPKAATTPETFQYLMQEMYNYRLPKEKKLKFLSATEADKLTKNKV